jgi:hypothetical protein
MWEIVESQGEATPTRGNPEDLHKAQAQRLDAGTAQAIAFEDGFGQASLQPPPPPAQSMPAGVAVGRLFPHARTYLRRYEGAPPPSGVRLAKVVIASCS